MVSEMSRPKHPRCELCRSNKPLLFGDHTCEVCKRVCGCGRLIGYDGRGQPRKRCQHCSELHPGKIRCPCGRVVPRGGRSKYCSHRCSEEARRIRAGYTPKLSWKPDLAGVAALEERHQRATRFVLAWLRLRSGRPLTEKINSIWERTSRIFEVRQTILDFTPRRGTDHGGLPEWVMLDDEPRYSALRPPPAGYILLNSRRTAMAATSAAPYKAAAWKRMKMWVPRYNDWETVVLASRVDCDITALNLDGLPNPFDEMKPTG